MRINRAIAAATAALAGLTLWSAALAAPTPPIKDPTAFVTQVYKRLAADPNYAPPTDIDSPRLKALWAAMVADAHGEVPRVDFEFWTNAQDWSIKDVKVTSTKVFGRPDRQVVSAAFHNGDRAEQIRFYWERVGGRWLLDDARSTTGEGWTLSLIVKYGFDGE